MVWAITPDGAPISLGEAAAYNSDWERESLEKMWGTRFFPPSYCSTLLFGPGKTVLSDTPSPKFESTLVTMRQNSFGLPS
jgi:hypothetical protein